MKLSTRAFFKHGILVLFLLLLVTSHSGLMGQVQTIGSWSTASYTMPINPVHVALLHNGKILVVAGSGNCPASLAGCPSGAPYGASNGSGALLVDPTGGSITQFSVSWDMFCNGMVVLPDGRAFINGGTLAYDPFKGSVRSSIFDPATNTFSDAQNMAHGRWYPTVLTLGDGRIMTFSGFLETGENTNTTVEFYTVGSGWSQPFTAPFTPDLYPRLHVLPNGKVFYSGAPPVSELFDPSSTTWTLNVATTNYGGTREYGSSVLLGLTPANNYDPVVLILGGDSPATKTTETIDMGASSPKWQYGPNMSQARIEMNAVILPNGKVLAVGGSVNDEDASTKSLNADLYDPATNTISSAGANVYARLYHSVALLLPDATVWLAGGNPTRGSYESHVEIYKPAYLYQSNGSLATRPTITSAPASISYGNPFTVQTPDSASIASAVLIRNGTVTHAFGMDQRMVGMSFTAGSGSLTITAPPNGNIAPPGYYMLFLLNSAGVPSVAKFVQVTSSGSSGPPSGISFVQGGTGPSTVQRSNSSVAVSFPSAQTAGDLNVVAVGWGDTTSSVSSVTDSRGNAYTRAVGPTTTTGLSQSIYYAKNIAAGSNTVTVTFNQAAAYPDVRILEYSGLDTSAPLDVTAAAVGSGTSANSGSATTTSANELIFGAGSTTGTAYTGGGSGFTARIINNFGNLAEDKTVASTGSNSATAPNSSGNWVMQMATFKGSGQGGGTGNPAPTVTSITPNSGTANGGMAVTITGTGFLTGATVSLGGTAATGVSVVNSTTITATTAAHTAGAVNVVVTNTDSKTGTLASGYTYTTASGGSINFVQVGSGPSTVKASNSAVVVAYPATQTAGDLNVVAVGWGDTTSSVSSVTDSRGNVYTRAVGPTTTTGLSQSIYYAKNIAAGSNTVTVTFNQAAAYPDVRILEYSGLDTSAPLDVTAAAVGSGTSANSGSATTTSANELIFGAGSTTGTAYTGGGSGFTARIINNFGNLAEDKTVASTGSNSATAPNSSGNWVMQMATFKGSGQGGGTGNPAPTVTSITPNSGTANGGMAVTITGTGFLTGATVSLGGTAATGVSVVNSTTITATTAAHTAGAVNVVVTNTDSKTGTLASGYTYTTASGGSINFVQVGSGPSTVKASNSAVVVAYPATQTAGDLNVVAVGWGDTTSSVSSVTDSRGNVYTRAVGPTTTTGLSQSIYYAKNIAAGSNTVTVTFNQAAAYPDVRILEYSGLDTSAPLDVTAAAVGSGTSANSGSATTTSANELIFGAGSTTGTAYTGGGSGFTARIINNFGNLAEDKTVASTGSNSATAPNSSGNWVMQMATFKAKP